MPEPMSYEMAIKAEKDAADLVRESGMDPNHPSIAMGLLIHVLIDIREELTALREAVVRIADPCTQPRSGPGQ